MGLFSRKKTEHTTRSASRTATSSEAQAAELRGRARRRLIGALVLVLTAVIVVPMMFDDNTSPQQDTPLVLPAIIPPVPEPDLALTAPSDYSVDEPVLSGGDIMTFEEGMTDVPSAEPQPSVQDTPAQADPVQTKPTSPEPDPVAEPVKPEPARTEPPARPADPQASAPRTDDGSVALALLEGRAPPQSSNSKAPAPQQGSFVLQIAAYSTEADAQSRRTSLVNAGVTNAYVEQGTSNNKPTYRLRVGTFPTRDAAQAAQARLRALGYDNSLLLTQ